MTPCDRLARLQKYVARWGVSLVWYSDAVGNAHTHSGPGCADLNLDTQTIFVSDHHVLSPTNVIGNVLHELSHLLTPENPGRADELFGPMLALDWTHHRFLGEEVAYQEMMASFQVDSAKMNRMWAEWPDLTYPEQVRFLNDSHAKAKHLGLVSHWRPTFARGRATMERLREVSPLDK